MFVAPPPVSLTLNLCTLQLGGLNGWVDVSAPECLLLTALAAAAGQRLDTPGMLEQARKSADAAGKRALEVQLVRLRKKLAKAGANSPSIKVIRGFGYQLCVPLTIHSSFTKPS
jgi:DNA-binding response OmpR family regulator